MKDLDWADVYADAQRMEDEMDYQRYADLDNQDSAELGRMRYNIGADARGGDYSAIKLVEMLDHILLTRIITELCEGCWGRWGCDMCNPPQFDMMDMIPAGTPDSWIPDNPNEDGFRQSDFI